MSHRKNAGFALVLVLWTLALLSTLALTFASTVQTETRSAQDIWNDLQTERLAKSGHDFTAYLESRGIGTTTEDFTGLPVNTLVQGYRYRIDISGVGTIELFLEGENGRIDLSSLDEEAALRFFTAWTRDADRSRRISDSLMDWIDPDDSVRAMGAESSSYAGNGYLPRNGPLGAADLFLIRGLTHDDFFPSVVESSDGVTLRSTLLWSIATTPVGNAVNPNYASRIVLQSVAGMTSALVDRILELRRTSIFKNQEDLRQRTGVDSSLLNRLVFNRGIAPAVLSLATLEHSSRVRTERRVQTSIRPRGWRPGMRLQPVVWDVERYVPLQ